ncbi:MAG: UPF0164 family protein [Myxococcota bacterium]
MSRASGVALLVLLTLPARVTRADDTHYQDFVIGGRAVGLGGAFTAIADDPSGLFYNPAGIADVRQTNLQVSASLYGFERGGIGDRLSVPVPGVEDLDIEFTELIVIPSSAGFISNLDAKLPNGQNRHSYGVTVIVPSFRSFAANENQGATTYRRRVTDRELWAGAGYGLRLTPRLSVGVSGFYILRTVVDTESLAANETLEGETDRFQTVSNDISLVNGNVVFVGGVKFLATPKLSLGASLRSPSIGVHSDGDLFFERAESDPSSDTTISGFERQVIEGRNSETRYSPVARFGVAYQEPYQFTVSADASVHLPVDYRLIDIDDEAIRQRLPFNPDVERRTVVNLNAGVEYLLVREVSVALGGFTNFSSAPSISEQPTTDQLPHVDMLGLTLALGYFGEYTLSRLGVQFSAGTGQDVLPESDIARLVDGDLSFRRVDFSQSFFYVFLSSTFRY